MDKTKTFKMKQKNKKILFWSLGFLLIFAVVGGLIWAFMPGSILNPDDDDDETDTTLLVSTFTFYSAQDGEDVSSFVEVDLWGPKSGATFEDGYDDITALTANFELIETGKDAEDISVDLRDEPYYWLEVTGNSVFNNTFYLLIGGANYNYLKYIHDQTSDVNFAISGDTMNPLQYGILANDTKGIDGNYTATLRAPFYTTTVTEVHYGDNWALSTTDFADLSASAKEVYWNEMYWRDQFPTYDPTLDTSNEYDRDFEKLTNTFALKWTFNTTINTTVGADAELTCTIDKGYPIEIVISGANLYMVWDEGINFNPDYMFTFELTFGTHINVTTVISGRANIPGDLPTTTWAETYSIIGL